MVQRVKLKKGTVITGRTQSTNPAISQSPRRSDVVKKVQQCKHCKHWYLYPCTDPGAELDCLNYIHLQSIKKGKRK